MFGYVVANKSRLNEEEKEFYQSCYCGLCRELKKRGRFIPTLTLNYDMAFLAVVLMSLYSLPCEEGECRCFLKRKKSSCIGGEIMEYTADMNLILSYYKMKDDWTDDRNIFAYLFSKRLEKQVEKISVKRKDKAEKIKEYLDKLSLSEKKNMLDPDGEALLFGKIMGEVFTPYEEREEELFAFGESLGKFIYILDAVMDLKKDIKRKKYNPLILTEKASHKGMLDILMADCLEAYEKLECDKNRGIIENILLSGVWTGYALKNERMKNR